MGTKTKKKRPYVRRNKKVDVKWVCTTCGFDANSAWDAKLHYKETGHPSQKDLKDERRLEKATAKLKKKRNGGNRITRPPRATEAANAHPNFCPNCAYPIGKLNGMNH